MEKGDEMKAKCAWVLVKFQMLENMSWCLSLAEMNLDWTPLFLDKNDQTIFYTKS